MNLQLQRANGNLLCLIKTHCEMHHYLHRYPDPRALPFAYAVRVNGELLAASNGLLNGLLVFKKPQHHRQRGLFGYDGLPTAWQVLDLARVWINPCWQLTGLNMFSRMIGLAMRRLQWDWLEHHPPVFPDLPYHIVLVISYCELAHHDGTAYRACSFSFGGRTNDGTKELYYRKLRTPLKSWKLPNDVQLPLLNGVPLVY